MRTKQIVWIVVLVAAASVVRAWLDPTAISKEPTNKNAEVTVDFQHASVSSISIAFSPGWSLGMRTGTFPSGMRAWYFDESGTKRLEVVAESVHNCDGRAEGHIQLLTLFPVRLVVAGIPHPRIKGIDDKTELPVDLAVGVYNLTITSDSAVESGLTASNLVDHPPASDEPTTTHPANADPLQAKAFVLQWRDEIASPYRAYRVSSDEGVSRVRDWMRVYDQKLRTSAQVGPLMSAMPNEYFWAMQDDGTLVEIPIVFRYPADFSIPKGYQTELIVNFSAADFDALRRIFAETGVVVESQSVP